MLSLVWPTLRTSTQILRGAAIRGLIISRTYKMTIASTWYDKTAGAQREYEMHFEVVRSGKIRNVTRTLRRRGIPYFQQTVYRKFGKWIPRPRIRGKFELIEPTVQRPQRTITVAVRGMQYRGKKWKATKLPPRMLPYAKKKHKRKSTKRKRA